MDVLSIEGERLVGWIEADTLHHPGILSLAHLLDQGSVVGVQDIDLPPLDEGLLILTDEKLVPTYNGMMVLDQILLKII